MDQRRVLPAIGRGQILIHAFGQRVVCCIPPLTTPFGQKTVVDNRVDPASQIGLEPPPVPVGKRPFEAVLHEIVGMLQVAAQQCACEPPQPGNVHFEKSRRVWGAPPTDTVFRQRSSLTILRKPLTGISMIRLLDQQRASAREPKKAEVWPQMN